MTIFQEELLEPIARRIRFKKSLDYINSEKNLEVVDLGCGPKLRFLKFLALNNFGIKHYIGIDPMINYSFVSRFKNHKTINIINSPLDKKINLKSNSVDFVFAFAFLEHIDNPKEILEEAYRILKPGGKIILTTPSYKAKTILEFLSYKLRLISEKEIREHKQYFDYNSLMKITPSQVSKKKIKHEYFEFGLNNLLVITK